MFCFISRTEVRGRKKFYRNAVVYKFVRSLASIGRPPHATFVFIKFLPLLFLCKGHFKVSGIIRFDGLKLPFNDFCYIKILFHKVTVLPMYLP